jgi:hypothetical protein
MPDWITALLLIGVYVIGYMDGRGSAMDHVPFWRGWNSARALYFWKRKT